MFRTVVPLSLLLLAAAGPAPARQRAHPAAPPDPSAEACVGCHARATPAVVSSWESGGHGLVLVKCFVCHGTTGADFRRSPDLARCGGCHAANVASAARAKAGGCFGCHAPHDLAAAQGKPNPHTTLAR